jgi:hypothetical protein
MSKLAIFISALALGISVETTAADEVSGLRGDPAAIADAVAMVEAMGGQAIWRDLEAVHFVHEWDIVNRHDRYLENEILDLTGPRSYVTMESEIYSRVRAYARGDSDLEVGFGTIPGIPGPPAIEFAGPDGVAHGWVLVNARKEPIIWATTQYVYVFGPLKRFGNLLVPNWATTSNGLVRYEMVSLAGSNERPDLSLFAPPAEMVGGTD